VVRKREGMAVARNKFKTTERKRDTLFPGQEVQFDAWMFHVVTLDVTRERWLAMTEEERKRIKRVRRWVVVAIDVATRCIFGFSICRKPNEQASLEALRMCFLDKTYVLRDAGIKKSTWNYVTRHHLTMTDSGSEFGKHPFGGALFAQAVRTLSGSMMNTTAGVPELRAHIERFFFTCKLKFARSVPGWTASNPGRLNDRKPYEEACLTDDELQEAFLGFAAEYHATPHRGLDYRTPDGVWAEMTSAPGFDDEVPGPGTLREACGFYTEAEVVENGIRFARNSYSNGSVRDQRFAAVGKTVEIKVDPFNLGAISVLTKDGLISVQCMNAEMAGKSLREADREHEIKRLEARADVSEHAEQRAEANQAWRSLVGASMKRADIGILGYTDAEVSWARREMDFGKGHHEELFVGRDEYVDPIMGGYQTGTGSAVSEDESQTVVGPDALNSSDRFRSATKRGNRQGGASWGENE
jgi:putative transposase